MSASAKRARAGNTQPNTVRLVPCAPYDLSLAARFFALRTTAPEGAPSTVSASEAGAPDEKSTSGRRYDRLTLYPVLQGQAVEILVRNSGSVLRPELSVTWRTLPWKTGRDSTGTVTCEDVTNHVAKVLSLAVDLSAFYKALSSDSHLSGLNKSLCGLKPALTATVFDAAVWAIVGQQVTLGFALTLKERLSRTFGRPFLCDGAKCGSAERFALPDPVALAGTNVTSLRKLQLSERKAEYLLGLARAVVTGQLELEKMRNEPYELACDKLLKVRGIGKWTANYILMRGAGHLDALPLGDAGLRRAIRSAYKLDRQPDDSEISTLGERYRPYRSLFTLYLWQAFA